MSDFIEVCNDSDVAEGRIFAAWAGDVSVALTRVNGKLHAFANVCTHDDGPLDEGEIQDCGDGNMCAVCPRHGARFNLASGKGTFPAASPIDIYETRVTDGAVWVRV